MADLETTELVIGMGIVVIITLIPFYRMFFRREPTPVQPLEQEDSGAQDAGPGKKPVPVPQAKPQPLSPPVRTAQPPRPTARAAGDTLAAEIQAGYIRIVAKTKSLQDQLQLLSSIRGSLDPAHPLDREQAEKFEENTKDLDRLADRYIVAYHELRVLLENENLIRSPDVLQIHRTREFEKLQQLVSLSREIQPLLNENEDIIAPFIGYAR